MELLYYWRGPVFPVFPNVNRTHALVTFSYYLFVCLFTYFLSHHLEGIPEGQQCCWLLHRSASGSPVTLPPTGKYWTTIPRPCAFYALIDITRGALVEMLLCLSSICFFSITHRCVVAHFTLLLNDFRKVTQQGRTRTEQEPNKIENPPFYLRSSKHQYL